MCVKFWLFDHGIRMINNHQTVAVASHRGCGLIDFKKFRQSPTPYQ